jgi:O-antigen/teichoic acid export membrane protein
MPSGAPGFTGKFAAIAHRLKLEFQTRLHSASHGERRLRRAGLTGLVTLLARGIGLSVSLLSLPFASHYLGKERFGLWLVLIGLVNWVSLADLGLANGLINALAAADGREDRGQAQTVIASAFWVSLTVAVGLLLLFLSLSPFLDWAALFNVVSPQARAEAGLAAGIVMFCFVLRMLAGLLSSVYFAYQEGYLYQCWSAVCGLLSACGLIGAIKLQAGLPALVGGFVGGWLVGELLSALYLFGWHRPWLRPAWRHFDKTQARHLLRSGSQLWVAQISHVALLQTDLLVVTVLFGAQAVAGYGTSLRLFTLVGAVQAAFVSPLWAAYSEALARRDVRWLRQTFNRSLLLSLAWSLPASVLVYLCAPWLFRLLVTPDVQPQRDLLLVLLVAEVFNAIRTCLAMVLNGLGAFRSQVICGPLAGLCNLGLSWWLGKRLGLPGVAWATVISLLIFWVGLIGYDAHVRMRQLAR